MKELTNGSYTPLFNSLSTYVFIGKVTMVKHLLEILNLNLNFLVLKADSLCEHAT